MRPAPTVLCVAVAVLVPSARAAPTDESARVERVADGVYVILHDNATEDWPHGNTGVVIGETGVLVVDSTYLPSRARADIALIRKLTDKPVRFLAYTHWHFDHNNGGIAYRQAFPAVDVVSARDTARYIELNGVWWSRRQAASGSSHRKTLAGVEAQLASGKDEKGQPLSAERRRTLAADAAHRKGELDEFGAPEQIQEEVTLDDVRRSCPVWTPASLDEDWRQSVKTLVERSFRGVRGQG